MILSKFLPTSTNQMLQFVTEPTCFPSWVALNITNGTGFQHPEIVCTELPPKNQNSVTVTLRFWRKTNQVHASLHHLLAIPSSVSGHKRNSTTHHTLRKHKLSAVLSSPFIKLYKHKHSGYNHIWATKNNSYVPLHWLFNRDPYN